MTAWCCRGLRNATLCRLCRTITRYFAMSGRPSDVPGFRARIVADRMPTLILVFEADVPWLPSKVSPPARMRGSCRLARTRCMRATDAQFSVRPDDDRDVLVCPGGAGGGAGTMACNAEARCRTRRERLTERSAVVCTPTWATEVEQAGRGDDDHAALAEPLPARSDRWRYDRRQRIFVPPGVLPAAYARQPVRRQFGRRPGLGISGRARQSSWRRRSSLVVSLLGDGAYMFANPTACHYTGRRCRSCRC